MVDIGISLMGRCDGFTAGNPSGVVFLAIFEWNAQDLLADKGDGLL